MMPSAAFFCVGSGQRFHSPILNELLRLAPLSVPPLLLKPKTLSDSEDTCNPTNPTGVTEADTDKQ